MASRKKKKYVPKSFESTGEPGDTSANIYESMLLNEAFQSLTKNQRLLYVYMKKQTYKHRKPGQDFPDRPDLQGDDMFYFNLALAEKYALYTRSNKKQFYDDVHAIEEHGFIKTVSNGQATKTRSIYQFSDSWKRWHDTS